MHNKITANQSTKRNEGFTAVELLITLFVAVAFLLTGYMLYGTILNRSAEARTEAQADNIAYGYLRRYEASVPASCVSSTPLNNSAITGDATGGLASPKVTVQISCPTSTVSGVSKINVRVDYANNGKANFVQHEIYASEK